MKGWCQLCPYWTYFLCSLYKKAWCSVFYPNGWIWASVKMVEAAAAAVGSGAVLAKTAASGVNLLLS